jgi:branched-chain amino acid transport system substrate-binding protein
MKKILTATATMALLAGAAQADEIKLGVLLGFTGPAESLAGHMADGAEAAFDEVTQSGLLLGGMSVSSVRADTSCVDASVATAAAERLITGDGVSGIVGALCSTSTTAAFQNVARANGMVMISPASTSPALSTIEDDGLFFRTAPSDARQGVVMAEVLLEQGINSVAVTYTNNDYGKGLADSFQTAYEERGGTVTINAAHEDGKADYSAEVASLAAAGGDRLVVAGYIDQGGPGIIRAALDTGAFDTFHLPDGMIGDSLQERFGDEIEGSTGQVPGTDSPGAAMMEEVGAKYDFQGTAPFAPESYDAAALIMLAMQATGSTDPMVYKDAVMDVANAPGEMIYPGELAKALQILADGGDVDYQGGSAVELIGGGESAGNYRQIEVIDGVITTVQYR